MAGPNAPLPLPRGHVPPTCPGDRWILEVQSMAHNELDYLAVMASRGHLRAWSNSTWPEDDFTLAANAEDLAGHIDDARQGLAYGYSVLTADRGQLLGSLYLSSVGFLVENYQVDETARSLLGAAGVEADYWLRPEAEADDALQGDFISTIDHWLRQDWGFAQPLWGSRRAMPARREFYTRRNWRELLRLVAKNDPNRVFWLHAAPTV
jgi:hypothetical protein